MAPRAGKGLAAIASTLPYAAIAVVLRQWPLPWLEAIGHASLLLALMAAHAACYRLWQPHAPGRILANELLARLWFATYALLLAGLLDGDLAVLALGFPLAVSSWLVHRRLVARGYGLAQNVLHLGVLLLLLVMLLTAAT